MSSEKSYLPLSLPVYTSEDDLDTVQVQMVTSESPVWSLLFFSVISAKQGFDLCLHIITVHFASTMYSGKQLICQRHIALSETGL